MSQNKNKQKDDLKNFIDLIDKASSEKTYDVFIPSLNEDIKFKPLNTSQQKSLIKAIVDNPVHQTKFIIALRDIINSNIIEKEKYTTELLNIFDKAVIALQIRINDINPNLTVQKNQKNIEIDLNEIIENVKQYPEKIEELKTKIIEHENYKIFCTIPSIETEYRLEKELNDYNSDINIDDINVLTKTMSNAFINEIAKYCHQISYDEVVIDLSKYKFLDRINILEKLPSKAMKNVLLYINEVNTMINNDLKSWNDGSFEIDSTLFTSR